MSGPEYWSYESHFCFLSSLSCKLQARKTFMSIGADVMEISWLKEKISPFFGKKDSFGVFSPSFRTFLLIQVHLETAGPKSDRESNFSGSQQKSLCFCSRNNVTIIFFPTESGNYDFSEKKRNYGARRIFYDRRIFYEAQRMAVVLPLTPPKKRKNRFYSKLTQCYPHCQGWKRTGI